MSWNALIVVVGVVSAIASLLSFGLSTLDVWQKSRRTGMRIIAAFLGLSAPLAFIAWYGASAPISNPDFDRDHGRPPASESSELPNDASGRNAGRERPGVQGSPIGGDAATRPANPARSDRDRGDSIGDRGASQTTGNDQAGIKPGKEPPILLNLEDLEVVIVSITRLRESEEAVEVTAWVRPRSPNQFPIQRLVFPPGTVVFGRDGQTRTAGIPLTVIQGESHRTAVASVPIVGGRTEICARFIPDGAGPRADIPWQAKQAVNLDELKPGDSWTRGPDPQH